MRFGSFPCLALFLFMAVPAHAADIADTSFTVADIRIIGLQRVSEGSVFNYLPVNIGDDMNLRRTREAIRALYATGFFRTVELRRDGDVLLVVVGERPSIETLEIKGNKDIKTEDLTRSLRGVGLAQGKTFDRSVLEDVKGFLTDQYFSRGKYGVQVDTQVQELADNRVSVLIDIAEGDRAKIRQISIIGNTKFREQEILDTFELETPGLLNFYRDQTRYSRESLQGDLEKLKSFYQDRGYANFNIESAQVTISPEKDDMFITISISEGEVYQVADSKIAGNTIVPLPELQRLLLVQKGQTYSQQLVSTTQKLLENRLNLEGYAFARVDPIPRLDNEKREVVMTFLIDPGKRVYVRHINFTGIERTQDIVLRREMRQLEGATVSNMLLERSKQRIQRLPYIEKVDYEKTKVDGTDDMVDVTYTIKEGPSASLSGGLGYSAAGSFSLQGDYADSNFLGTGRRVAFNISGGRYAQVYNISHTEPYVTIDGLSRTANLAYTRMSQLTSSYSDFANETWSTGLNYGWPISELQTIRLGASLQHINFSTNSLSSDQLWYWVRHNGTKDYVRGDDSILIQGNLANLIEVNTAWNYEGRNRSLFPTAGSSHTFSLNFTVPGSGLQYYTATYAFEQYLRLPLPVIRHVPFRFTSTVGFGGAYGSTTALPPTRHWFVGGPDSVRGFRESTLGPRDSIGNPYGGDSALYGSAEAIIPLPEKWQSSARLTAFYDVGQAFYLGHTDFRDKLGSLTDTGFSLKRLRRSAGLGIQWLSPMGLFRFSYAIPLNYQKSTERLYGDERERFQFSIGQAF